MTAEELWEESGLSGDHEAWAFGEAPDKLAELVVQEIKTATCSAYDLYQINNEPILKVYVTEFSNVSEEHAFKEGEGDRSLEYWRLVHIDFLTKELAAVHKTFDENTKVVCEEFEVVYKKPR